MVLYIKQIARKYTPGLVSVYREIRNGAATRRKAVMPKFERAAGKRRLLIDVTSTADADYVSGIQRVVARLAQEMSLQRDSLELDPVPVRLRLIGTKLHLKRAVDFEKRLGLPSGAENIALRDSDIIFMLDSSWIEFRKYSEFIFPAFKQRGGTVVTCLYDLIPVSHPQFCDVHLTNTFRSWVPLMIKDSDAVVCISEATASAFRAHLAREKLPFAGPIASFHLGADFHHERDLGAAENDIVPTVLMVGTIEPRKGHRDAFEAFEKLWAAGLAVNLHIVGRNGWLMDDFIDQIKKHPLFDERLFLSTSASDADLAQAYHRASLVLSASLIEGFCLPLVEAASYGKPLIVSDIPSSREVCGQNAIFYQPGDSVDLAGAISTWLSTRNTPEPIAYLSWAQSAASVTDKIANAVSSLESHRDFIPLVR